MNIKLNSGLLIQKVVDEVVILEPDSGDYYTLNATGAIMLEMLQQGNSIGEISKQMSAEFDASASDIEHDLKQLLADLERNGLAHSEDA